MATLIAEPRLIPPSLEFPSSRKAITGIDIPFLLPTDHVKDAGQSNQRNDLELQPRLAVSGCSDINRRSASRRQSIPRLGDLFKVKARGLWNIGEPAVSTAQSLTHPGVKSTDVVQPLQNETVPPVADTPLTNRSFSQHTPEFTTTLGSRLKTLLSTTGTDSESPHSPIFDSSAESQATQASTPEEYDTPESSKSSPSNTRQPRISDPPTRLDARHVRANAPLSTTRRRSTHEPTSKEPSSHSVDLKRHVDQFDDIAVAKSAVVTAHDVTDTGGKIQDHVKGSTSMRSILAKHSLLAAPDNGLSLLRAIYQFPPALHGSGHQQTAIYPSDGPYQQAPEPRNAVDAVLDKPTSAEVVHPRRYNKRLLLQSKLQQRGLLPLDTTNIKDAPKPGEVHVFIDMSNIFIGFQDRAKIQSGRNASDLSYFPYWNMCFEHLSMILERGRSVGKRYVAGSVKRPEQVEYPPDHFKEAENCGYECHILIQVSKVEPVPYLLTGYMSRAALAGKSTAAWTSTSEDESGGSRNRRRKFGEQGVDENLHFSMLQSLWENQSNPGTMVIATGDARQAEHSAGFAHYALEALKAGWNVEIVSWKRSLSFDWKRAPFTEKYARQFRIVELDPFFSEMHDDWS